MYGGSVDCFSTNAAAAAAAADVLCIPLSSTGQTVFFVYVHSVLSVRPTFFYLCHFTFECLPLPKDLSCFATFLSFSFLSFQFSAQAACTA